MNNDRCETCRFFVGVDGLTYAPSQPMCRRLPEGLLKEPNDWCGEYKPATPPDTQVVVTSFGAGSWIRRSPANFPNGTPPAQKPDDPPNSIAHFKTQEMLHALSLSIDSDGQLWTTINKMPCQCLNWTAEEAIALTVGRMLDPKVRDDILQNATEYQAGD